MLAVTTLKQLGTLRLLQLSRLPDKEYLVPTSGLDEDGLSASAT